VELLAESGVTPGSARAAISRLSRRGVIESRRQARHSSCRLTPSMADSLALGGAAIAAFPAAAELWDGHWTLVAFSLPQNGDARRRALRNQLRWLGYTPLYDALWVSPLAPLDGMAENLARTGLGMITVFRARWVELDGVTGRDPLDAWDVAGIARQYEAFIERWSPLLSRIRAGGVRGAEALQARTAVMDTYRFFLTLDPRLPMRLMPEGWPRERAERVFVDAYDGLLDAALEHVVQTVARFAGDPPPRIAAHTVADMLAGPGNWP
jgi:phenylacetic acid degradation operon negative regulatory protein